MSPRAQLVDETEASEGSQAPDAWDREWGLRCDACGDDPSEWPCVVCHKGEQGHEVYRPDPEADAEADRVMLGDGLDLPGRCPQCREVMLRVPCLHVVSVRGGGWRQVGDRWASVCLSCAGDGAA